MNWIDFKHKSEEKFKSIVLDKCYGPQIQPGSKWNNGLSQKEISELEKKLGFELPTDYSAMISTMNGLDRDEISVDPEDIEESQFTRNLYKYPEDLSETEWLLSEIKDNIKYVHEALAPYKYDIKDTIGFVPLYGHRVLVVFNDKSLTPVISIHQGTDVIVYGHNLVDFWKKELSLVGGY